MKDQRTIEISNSFAPGQREIGKDDFVQSFTWHIQALLNSSIAQGQNAKSYTRGQLEDILQWIGEEAEQLFEKEHQTSLDEAYNLVTTQTSKGATQS